MLWKKNKPQDSAPRSAPATSPAPTTSGNAGAQAAPAPNPAASADEFERALDAIGALVRAIGRFALDTPDLSAKQTGELAEHWSQHLLIRRPKPGDSTRASAATRDYRGVVDFVTQQRKNEHAYVARALDDLKHTVWAFIQGLRRGLADEDDDESRVKAQLDELRNAAEHGSTDDLRRIAIATAKSVGQVLADRRKRHSERNVELGQHITALQRQLEDARRKSELDPLTDVCNRGAFDEYVRQLVGLSTFVNHENCLLLVDLDHFKRVNDTHGHVAGDEVLKAVSKCLVRTFPRKNDFIARYGGEEFAVVLSDIDLKAATLLGERLRAALHKLEVPSAPDIAITASIGAALLRRGEEPVQWISRADRALYEAKNSGRDRLVVASV